MNEEHKREIIAKDDEKETLQSQNLQLQVELVQKRSNTLFFVYPAVNSLLALDYGNEKVRRIVAQQLNFKKKKIIEL